MSEVIAAAKASSIKGEILKMFRNGQELRQYVLVVDGAPCVWKIRAFAHEHA